MFVKDKFFYKRFFAIMLTIAMGNLLSFGVNLVDNVMLGNYNQAALSGNALSDQVQYLIQMVVSSLGEGLVIFGSRYWGQEKPDGVKKITSIALRVTVGFCAFMTLICALFPSFIIGLLAKDTQVVYQGAKLLRMVSFSYIFFGASTVIMASLRSIQSVRISLVSSFVTLLISIFFNYVFIFGKLGMPSLGILGAGIATIVTRVVELLILIVYLKFKESNLFFKLKDFTYWNKSLWKDYFKTVTPIVGGGAIWGVASMIQTAILGNMGSDVIAANAIAVVAFQIISVFSYGSANAAGVLTGNAVGKGDIQYIKKQSNTLQIVFVGIGFITGTALFLSRNLVISFYQVTPQAKQYALQFMTVLSITVIGTSYQMAALGGIVKAGGDTSFVLKNDAIFMYAIVLPATLLTSRVFKLAPVVVYACLKSDQILKCFVAIFKVNSFNWVKNITSKSQEPGKVKQ